MDSVDIVFWLCAVLNLAIVGAAIVRFRSQVRTKKLPERKAKAMFTWICLAIGVFCGVPLFLGLTTLFDIPLGHGEAMIAAPVFNFLLALVLAVSGRIAIGWSPIRW